MIYLGTIEDIVGSWGSGILELTISGKKFVADNAPMVRSLDSLFDCIGTGHTIDRDSVIGQRLAFTTAEWAEDFIESIGPDFEPDREVVTDLDLEKDNV